MGAPAHPVLSAASGGRPSVDKGVVVVTARGVNFAALATQNIFVADQAYRVVSVEEVHTVASAFGAMDVRRCQGTAAPIDGSLVTGGPFNLGSTANTVVSAPLAATEANRSLAEGDRLVMVFGGVLNDLEGLNVTVVLIPKSAGGDDTGNKRYWLTAA